MQVITINRYYINSELSPRTQILERLEPITGILEHSQKTIADILLILMEKDPDKVWEKLISSLRDLNIVTMADRLEKMTCAGMDVQSKLITFTPKYQYGKVE